MGTKKTQKKLSKQSWYALILLWLIFAMNGNGREIINRVLPGIIATYGISADTAGLMGTVSAIAMCIAALPLTRWVDKGAHGWKRKYRLIFVSGGYLVFMLLNGLSFATGTFTMVLVWQFFRGICSGAGEACEVGTVAEWWPKEKNGLAMGIHHAAYPWGTALGGVLVMAVLSVAGMENWRFVFIIFPVMGAVILLVYWKWSNAGSYGEFVKDTLDAGMTPPVQEDEMESAEAVNQKGSLGRALKNPNIVVTSVISMLCQFAYISLMFWMTPYLTFCAGYSATVASGLSVVYAITGGIGQIFWGNFADKYGTKRTMKICCVWLILAFFLMRYINLSVGLLIGLQLFLGCCSNAVYPVMYKIVADSSEKGCVVTGNGILTTVMFFGAAIATSLMGILIEKGGGWDSMSGYMTGVYVMVGAMVVALILAVFFIRETNGPGYGKDFALVSMKSCNLEEKN